MQLPHYIDLLVDFASQVTFANHLYVTRIAGRFALMKNKTDFQDLKELIRVILTSPQGLDDQQQRQIHAALNVVESHLTQKISGLFSFLIFYSKDKNRISEAIQEIRTFQVALKSSSNPQSEAEARLKFYTELPQLLNVKNAATHDRTAIKIVSKKLWDKLQNYSDYKKYMILLFEGEHFLFEEDDQTANNHYQLYDELRRPNTTAYVRGSSHYDRGRCNGLSPYLLDVQKAENLANWNPQYEVAGPQIKALLFGRVKLAFDSRHQPIFGKTFDQACEAAKLNHQAMPTKFKKYTFIQAEWWPDNPSFFTINFWMHRLVAANLYRYRRWLGFTKPNVGPYGYGHADQGPNAQFHPTMIK